MTFDLGGRDITPNWKTVALARPNKRYPRKVASPKQWARIRAQKLEGFPCRVCGGFGHHDPHHIVPRDRGGDDIAENIAPLCRRDHELVEGRDPAACLALIESTWQDQPEPGPYGGCRDEYSYAVDRAGEDWAESIYGVRYRRPTDA